MNGLSLSRAFFETHGLPMLLKEFADLLPHMAAGFFGAGSECFGFDDEISRDHDFEAGFCLLLPGEDVIDRRSAFLLERAYAKLPKEFMGVTRSLMQPVGGARRGVLRTEEFFSQLVGSADGVLTIPEWMSVPEQALAEATNGEVFLDNAGTVTRIRKRLAYFPEDVRRKKLAGHLLLMAQAGQYNYKRCLAHGETAAAQLSAVEFVKHTVSAIFLLNRVYQPYYKWSFRALRTLPLLSLEAELLEYLLTTDNEKEIAEEKYTVIEGIASDVIEEAQKQELTKAICGDLEKHAYSVNDTVSDGFLRNSHILAGV